MRTSRCCAARATKAKATATGRTGGSESWTHAEVSRRNSVPRLSVTSRRKPNRVGSTASSLRLVAQDFMRQGTELHAYGGAGLGEVVVAANRSSYPVGEPVLAALSARNSATKRRTIATRLAIATGTVGSVRVGRLRPPPAAHRIRAAILWAMARLTAIYSIHFHPG